MEKCIHETSMESFSLVQMCESFKFHANFMKNLAMSMDVLVHNTLYTQSTLIWLYLVLQSMQC